MGILRADRVSGLGGANAINGSVFFGGDQHLKVAPNSDFNLADNDFTLECWIYFSGFDGTGFDTITWSGLDGTAASRSFQWDYKNSANELRFIISVSDSGTTYASSWTASEDTWYHIAACRSGADLKLFVDGTQIGSTHNIGSNVIDYDNVPYGIGQRRGNLDRGVIGYISNYRLINGTALYTANFTAPTERLTNIDNTVLLCCQSPGNALKEETGKTIVSVLDNLNNAPPQASHFAPDLGEDYGTTFADNTKFDTLSYMVPPGGTTAQSNRGRGIYGLGGFPSYVNSIDFLAIQSTGNAQDFGDLTITKAFMAAAGNQTRSVFSRSYNGSGSNIMDFVTIATTSNALDFGDATTTAWAPAGCGNNTRGLFGGGAPAINILEYITFATAGNATDFGDLYSKRDMGGLSNSTRGVFAGGGDSPQVDTIEYVTIATTGNGTDFGNLTAATQGLTGSSNSTRGIFAGGYTPTVQNTIQYITIASTGDAVDFGDLTFTSFRGASCSSPTRSVIMQGFSPSGQVNSIDFITISTTGNASDFGDKTAASSQMSESGTSDCHGGIS